MAVTDIDQSFYNTLSQLRQAGQMNPDDQRAFDEMDRAGQFNTFKQTDTGPTVTPAEPAPAPQPAAQQQPAPTTTTTPTTAPTTTTHQLSQFRDVDPNAPPQLATVDQIKQPFVLSDEQPRGFWQALGDNMGLPPPAAGVDPDSLEGIYARHEAFTTPSFVRNVGRGLGAMARAIPGIPEAATEAITGSRELGNVVGYGLPAWYLKRRLGIKPLGKIAGAVRTLGK
jgi:hypothetical protein